MAAGPTLKPSLLREMRLTGFDPRYADRMVSWVSGNREAYWLAPRTKPPLTAEKVRAWASHDRDPLMLVAPGEAEPLAYGELNVLNQRRREYWLGHLIVDPRHRGAGLGRRLTEMLLYRAFELRLASRVSLVVFTENRVAVACYRAAGMRDDGFETHYFPPYQRRERLLRLTATCSWEQRSRIGRRTRANSW